MKLFALFLVFWSGLAVLTGTVKDITDKNYLKDVNKALYVFVESVLIFIFCMGLHILIYGG